MRGHGVQVVRHPFPHPIPDPRGSPCAILGVTGGHPMNPSIFVTMSLSGIFMPFLRVDVASTIRGSTGPG